MQAAGRARSSHKVGHREGRIISGPCRFFCRGGTDNEPVPGIRGAAWTDVHGREEAMYCGIWVQ